MRKIQFYHIILLGFIIFSSCSNNEGSNDIIIGKWRTIERYENNEPVEILDCTYDYYREFRANHVCAGFGTLPGNFIDPCNLVFIDNSATWKNLGNNNYKFTLKNGINYISKIYKDGDNLVEEFPNGTSKNIYESY